MHKPIDYTLYIQALRSVLDRGAKIKTVADEFSLRAFLEINSSDRYYFRNHYLEERPVEEIASEKGLSVSSVAHYCEVALRHFSLSLDREFRVAGHERALQECYLLLNSSPNEPDEIITEQYRKLIEECPSSRYCKSQAEVRVLMEAKTKALNSAYEYVIRVRTANRRRLADGNASLMSGQTNWI